MTASDMDRRFTFHPPADGDGRAEKHDQLRRGGRTLAELIAALVPDTAERKRAIDAVDDAIMLANAGLARGPLPDRLAINTHTINELSIGKLMPNPALNVSCAGAFRS